LTYKFFVTIVEIGYLTLWSKDNLHVHFTFWWHWLETFESEDF